MRILFVGDVVARAGRRILKGGLRAIRASHAPDLIIVNGENASRGRGLTPQCSEEIFRAGADVITSGNHVWDRREVLPLLEREPRVLRPANYPDPAPGSGVYLFDHLAAGPVAVVNLMGRLFMPAVDDPFRAADEILDELQGRAALVVIDFHAEATSEKIAFGWHVDGRVTAVIGTHTHIPTADESVLPGGTAYITDVGMTGPYDSVIGVDKTAVIERFRTQRPVRFSPAEG
ncbi:MAG: TIGR00282 family metallophosphoesterase, partial [Acidobacteriota bacterium]